MYQSVCTEPWCWLVLVRVSECPWVKSLLHSQTLKLIPADSVDCRPWSSLSDEFQLWWFFCELYSFVGWIGHPYPGENKAFYSCPMGLGDML